LVIEVDGGQYAVQVDRDTAGTWWLESQGFRVLRLWDNDVLGNREAVFESIC
jgi:very-short-patch-repair endonuclease